MGTARPLYKSFLSILQEELVPALGCTEPIAIAYAAAVAAHRAGGPPRSILAECSGNIIKNVKSVPRFPTPAECAESLLRPFWAPWAATRTGSWRSYRPSAPSRLPRRGLWRRPGSAGSHWPGISRACTCV